MIKNLIRKLYFKYCFKQETFAQEIVLYVVPKKFQEADWASILIAQINKGLEAETSVLRLVGFKTPGLELQLHEKNSIVVDLSKETA